MCPHNVNNIQWFSCVAKGNFLMLYLYFYRKDQEKRGSVFLILTVIIIEFLLKYSIQCHEKTGFDHSNGNCLENCSVHGTRYTVQRWPVCMNYVPFSSDFQHIERIENLRTVLQMFITSRWRTIHDYSLSEKWMFLACKLLLTTLAWKMSLF